MRGTHQLIKFAPLLIGLLLSNIDKGSTRSPAHYFALPQGPGLLNIFHISLCLSIPLLNISLIHNPSPDYTFKLQNLAEAEYVVGVFMYMRLLGYPAESISILTTYNGQKHLIRDVINQRCADNPLIGRPSKVGIGLLKIHMQFESSCKY